MIYLVGGAPRAGKSVLGQQLSTTLRVGWVSTDLLLDLLRVKGAAGIKHEWDAAPEAIAADAAWFFPCLERFIWGVSALADNYVIEGVDFLPAHVAQLSTQYRLRAAFLGCSGMTLERLTQAPGPRHGYSGLSEAQRRQIVQDVPRWSAFIQQEAERFGYLYVDTTSDFPQRLAAATAYLLAK